MSDFLHYSYSLLTCESSSRGRSHLAAALTLRPAGHVSMKHSIVNVPQVGVGKSPVGSNWVRFVRGGTCNPRLHAMIAWTAKGRTIDEANIQRRSRTPKPTERKVIATSSTSILTTQQPVACSCYSTRNAFRLLLRVSQVHLTLEGATQYP